MFQHHNLDPQTKLRRTFFNMALLLFLLGLCTSATLVFSANDFFIPESECGMDCLLDRASVGTLSIPARPTVNVGCSLREQLKVFDYSWQIGFMIACYTTSMLILALKRMHE